jgi:hypothetical protein
VTTRPAGRILPASFPGGQRALLSARFVVLVLWCAGLLIVLLDAKGKLLVAALLLLGAALVGAWVGRVRALRWPLLATACAAALL